MSNERDNESRYTKSTTRTVRTARTSATNATKASNASGASISSEQRSKEYSRQKDRDEGRDRERNRDRSRDRERDRYLSISSALSKTSSRAPSQASIITPSESISVCAPPKSRSSDQKSRSGSSTASSATIKPSHRKSTSGAPSIRSNLPTVPEDRTVIADPNNGYRRSANPSEASQGTYSSRTHESRHSSRKSQNIYNPAASRAPTELSNMSKAEISNFMPDAQDLQGIKNRHRSMGSVADSIMNHVERKAGRDLGNTLLLDEDGMPMGVAEMKLDSKYDEGGLFQLSRLDVGDKRLSDRRQRRGDSPGRSKYSDMRSDSGRRTVVPADYQFSERGSTISDIRSDSGRRTLVPAGYEFSDRGSSVSRNSSRTRTSAAPPSLASSRHKYKTKEVRPDGY